MLRTLLFTAAAATFSAPAFAGAFTVQTTQPFETTQRVVADKGVWKCRQNQCSADLRRDKVSVRGCKRVVKEIGPIVSYSNGDASLSEKDLAACNAVAS